MAAPTLILIPTVLEAKLLFRKPVSSAVRLALCGFSLAVAGARAAELLAREKPSRVVLIGIAGTLDADAAAVGSAWTFSTVRVDGIGCGEGSRFEDARALNLPLFSGEDGADAEPLYDSLPLAGPGSATLVSVASAAGSPEEALRRRRRHPGAIAEDMEAFAVAFACARAGVALHVVRGISNIAGERDKTEWRVKPALEAAKVMALELIGIPD